MKSKEQIKEELTVEQQRRLQEAIKQAGQGKVISLEEFYSRLKKIKKAL